MASSSALCKPDNHHGKLDSRKWVELVFLALALSLVEYNRLD